MPKIFSMEINGDTTNKDGKVYSFDAQVKFFESAIGKTYPIDMEDRIVHCIVKSITVSTDKEQHAVVEMEVGTVAMTVES